MVNSVAQLTGALITVAGVAFVLATIEPLLLGLVVLAGLPALDCGGAEQPRGVRVRLRDDAREP